jgi:hypothetical protein
MDEFFQKNGPPLQENLPDPTEPLSEGVSPPRAKGLPPQSQKQVSDVRQFMLPRFQNMHQALNHDDP